MAKLELINGCLIKYLEDKSNNFIVHCVNSHNKMGSGVAKVLFDKWPQVKNNYHAAMKAGAKLGEVQYVDCNNGKNQFVLNMIAQDDTGGHDFKLKTGNVHLPPVRYESLKQCMYSIAEIFHKRNLYEKGYNIVGPKFCCGFSEGKWNIVESLIQDIWVKNDIDVKIITI